MSARLFLLLMVSITICGQEKFVITGQETRRPPDGSIIYSKYFKIECEGLLLLTSDGAIITPDEVVRAEGNVKIDYQSTMGLVEVGADRVIFDLKSETAVFENVHAQFGDDFFFSGERLQIMNRSMLTIDKGTISSCNQPRPHWSLKIHHARVQKEGYAVIKGASFRIATLPVFYFPYLILPAFTERRTGLLIPATGDSSRNGRYFTIPFYWAPRRDFDLTFTPFYFEEAGWWFNLETRYTPKRDHAGELRANTIDDGALDRGDPGVLEDGKPIEHRRYRLEWKHAQSLLGGGLMVDVQEGSDFHVDRDFLQDTERSRIRDYYDRIRYQRNLVAGNLTLDLNHTRRILTTDARIHEITFLPSIMYHLATRPVGRGFFLGTRAMLDVVEFRDLGPDEIDDGFLRTAIDLELSRTLSAGAFLHSRYGVGFLGSQYWAAETRDDEALGGVYAFADLSGPRFARAYGGKSHRLVHFMDFGINLAHGTQEETPYFDQILLDEQDIRIDDQVQGLVTTWRFRSRFFKGGGPGILPVLDMEIRQRMDWSAKAESHPIVGEFRYHAPKGALINAVVGYEPDQNQVSSISVIAHLNASWWSSSAGYVKRTELDEQRQDSLIASAQVKSPNLPLIARAVFDYDFEASRFKSQEMQLGWNGSCMGVSLRYLRTPYTFSGGQENEWYRLTFSFRNMGEFGLKH